MAGSNSKTTRARKRGKRESRLRIFLLGDGQKPRVAAEVEHIRQFLKGRAEIVAVDLDHRLDLSSVQANVAVVLGGDGAILRAARQMGYHQLPVLGVNLGKLGFLAEVATKQFSESFEKLLAGDYQIVEHVMLECSVGTATSPGQKLLGLNEVMVHTGPPYHILDIELLIDHEHVTTYSADGLILATPIGSTAHSLAAGGPIVRQDLEAFVITPICPHTLTNRPLVDAADKTYELIVRGTDGILILDGQVQVPLESGQRVVVRSAPVTFGLVKIPGHSYYGRLRQKLSWGGQPIYNAEG